MTQLPPFKGLDLNGRFPFKERGSTHVTEPTSLIETEVPARYQENNVRAWVPSDGQRYLLLLHKQNILIVVPQSIVDGSDEDTFFQEDMLAYSNLVRHLGISNIDKL